MTVTLVVSPSATGKTRHCLDQSRRTQAEHKLLPAWVIVPDRLQTAAIRRRLAAAGGAIGVRVGTFGDLYQMVLLRASAPTPLAGEPVVYRLVQDAIREVAARGQLVHYAAVTRMPGFINALIGRIAELKQARVFPGPLLGIAEMHGPALVELARVYAEYQERLRAAGWVDPEGLNWLAVEALEREPGLISDLRLVVVDGFDSFNAAQLAAIRLLGQGGAEVLVTLPGSPDMARPAHRRFARSLDAFRRAIPDAELCDLPGEPTGPTPFRHLEKNLFESAAPALPSEGRIAFLEARSPADEAREALRWIKARIVRDGLRPDECALVTPDPERYRPFLREAGAEFGMPLRFTHGDALASAAGIAALLDLLALYPQKWPHSLTLEAIRSPYFDLARFGLTPQAAEPLELAGLAGPVIAGLDQWQDTLARLARLDAPPPREENEALQAPHLPVAAEADTLWQGLQALAQRLEPPGPQPTHAWVNWLEDLLEETTFFERQETDLDQAAALGLRETFRALVLGERVAGEQAVGYEDFLKELRSTLEGTFCREPATGRQPAVLVLRVLEARGLRFRAVALLGLSEGLFPEVEREDPFLGEKVRAELGLEPRIGREQGGLFYQAVTRADEFLLLTRPTLADDGERWEPSPYWNAATVLFTDPSVLVRPDDPRPVADAASPEEVLFTAVRRGSLPASYEELLPRFERLRHARDVLHARLAPQAVGPYEGDLSAARDRLTAAYGPDYSWSPSRLETYGTCPHWYFVSHVLGLEAREPPELGLDPSRLGTLLHAILEQAFREASDPTDADSVVAALNEAARTHFAQAPQVHAFRPSPLWAMEQEHLQERLTETVRELMALGGGWKPSALEAAFGLKDAPPLELEIDGEPVLLRGVIDRVDVNSSGELRVMDYKTGGSHLGSQDLIDGRRLQLPLYALAARDALGLGKPVEGLYWAILAAEAGALKLSRFKHETEDRTLSGPDGAAQVALAHVRRILTGVRAGAFQPEPPRGGCPSYCPAAVWCWRYAPSLW